MRRLGFGAKDAEGRPKPQMFNLTMAIRSIRHHDARMPFRHRAAPVNELSIDIEADRVVLQGNLAIPIGSTGIVLFAHGSGSSRHSPRNRFVASKLQRAGLATLLFDLLTEEEGVEDEETGQLRFDVLFLAKRLLAVTSWVQEQPETMGLQLGYFGASTGAAAALIAAAKRPSVVGAVVSRGGRPDLAGSYLEKVVAPTLLIVGSADQDVLALNQEAFELLGGPRDLALVPHATHLFEEPGAMEQVARLAGAWFTSHLVPRELRATG
jgi:putative phosphoribosyl transferase